MYICLTSTCTCVRQTWGSQSAHNNSEIFARILFSFAEVCTSCPGHEYFSNTFTCIQSGISLTSPQLFPRKRRKLSRHEYFLVLFMTKDKVLTIYSKFRFDYHKGKQPGNDKCTLTSKIAPILYPIMVFSQRLVM